MLSRGCFGVVPSDSSEETVFADEVDVCLFLLASHSNCSSWWRFLCRNNNWFSFSQSELLLFVVKTLISVCSTSRKHAESHLSEDIWSRGSPRENDRSWFSKLKSSTPQGTTLGRSRTRKRSSVRVLSQTDDLWCWVEENDFLLFQMDGSENLFPSLFEQRLWLFNESCLFLRGTLSNERTGRNSRISSSASEEKNVCSLNSCEWCWADPTWIGERKQMLFA